MSKQPSKISGLGLTYDDVLLVPSYSEVLPRNVNIQSQFSRNIPLNVPIVSAAMDTVTESQMAIAMAREGGLGVLHKNMSIEAQSEKVRKKSPEPASGGDQGRPLGHARLTGARDTHETDGAAGR